MDTSSNSGLISNARIESLTLDLQAKPLVYWEGNITASNALPVFRAVQTNGGGSNQPAFFPASTYTYVKNDPSEQPTERFSLRTFFDPQGAGWVITSEWEGYIGIPLTIAGTPLTFSVGANDAQQIAITSTNGGGGRLWVDSNGALYWNSNLLANA
jgi:hypothetical protein